MKVPFETIYNGYQIEITKPSTTYAYYVRGEDLDDSEGGFGTAKEALLAAKSLIDEDDFWQSPELARGDEKAKRLWGKPND